MALGFLGIQFAPLKVPLQRWLQTLSVATHAFLVTLLPMTGVIILGFLLMTRLWFVSAGYLFYIFYDTVILKTSQRGGRICQLLRSGLQVKYFLEYFPIKIVKTGELDPNKNYMVGYHPHGALPCGAMGAFAGDYMGFSQLYPGMRAVVLTMNCNLMAPFLREYALLMGVCAVGKESIEWLLTNQGTGNAIVIVVGGVEEALESKPGRHRVVLKNRKGFVRQAIKHGADLVPVYAFGETDSYNQVDNPHGSLLRTIQTKSKELLRGVAIPLFYGRRFGPLPHRTPINVVIGSAIPVLCEPSPSNALVDEYHTIYMDKLKQLFEEHKGHYGVPDHDHLEII